MIRLLNYLREAIRSPREQLSRGQQFLRKSLELVVYCYRQLQRQRADGMAAELTYRTIFALIPVVVLGLVMFRVVGGLEDVQAKVENQLFSFFGVPEITQGYEPLTPLASLEPAVSAERFQENTPPAREQSPADSNTPINTTKAPPSEPPASSLKERASNVTTLAETTKASSDDGSGTPVSSSESG